MGVARVRFFLFVLVSIFCLATSDEPDCVYTVYVQTGSMFLAGTDSIISLNLYDVDGYKTIINNLEAWGGLMGPDHDYFERGNLDIFSGRGSCLAGPVCAMNLTSDGSGENSGWYCEYVEVTTTGLNKQCTQDTFSVERWLDKYTPPYSLTALRSNCLAAKKKHSKVESSDMNVRGSPDNKKNLNVEGSDWNVEGSSDNKKYLMLRTVT